MDIIEHFDFNKISSYDELISTANCLKTDEKKVVFICKYFEQCVSYNYEKLFFIFPITGISQYYYTLDKLKDENILKHKDKTTYIREVLAMNSENKIFNTIQNRIKLCKFNSIEDIRELYKDTFEIMMIELNKFTKNKNIISLWKEQFKKYIYNYTYNNYYHYNKKDDYIVIDDITTIIFESFNNIKNIFPTKFENGLIKEGVCKDYADFIFQALTDLGLEVYKIKGISELKHAWNAVRINDKIKFIDITREINLRDEFGNIPKDQKGKWILTDINNMFNMQQKRQIHSINEVELDKYITKENHNNINIDLLFGKINQIIEKEKTKKV